MEPAAARNTAPIRRGRIFVGYVAAVSLCGIALLAGELSRMPRFLVTAPQAYWVMFVFAALVDWQPVRPTSGQRRISPVYPSICVTFAILLIWGLGPAVLAQAVAVGLSSMRLRHRAWRAVFNTAQYTVAFAAAGVVLRLAGGTPLAPGARFGLGDAMVVLAAAAAWFMVNYPLVAAAIWLRFGGSWWSLLTRTVGYEALSTGSLLMLAPVLAGAAHTEIALIPFVVVPLYAVNRMARLTREQERQARLDPLTGLANRKALMAEVADQVSAHRDRFEQHRYRAGQGRGHPGWRLAHHPGSPPVPAEPPDGAPPGAALAGPALPGAPVHPMLRPAIGVPPGGRFALLLLDLDRFKHVNDALGHMVGDRLLIAVGDRLRRVAPAGQLVARLGGDEFAFVAPELTSAEQARQVADRVAAVLAEPVSLDGLWLDVGASMGVAIYPDHGEDFATLMRHADVAMYDAKSRGDAYAVYAAESDHNSPERLGLLADLRRTLEAPDGDEIAFHYQPQVEIASGAVTGVEALLRWRHPRYGMIDPEELIRMAEHSAVMRLLTLRVIDDVSAQLAKWEADGVALRAAINVSVRDLHTSEIVDRLADRLSEYGLDPARIQLEITEGALMADPRRVLTTLRRLDHLGVALSLDDFGTGYSSMQHLRRLPLAEVKVDRSFVLGMATDQDDEAIVRSVIGLARALGLRVVAEGVEDEKTHRRLAACGCHTAQGWFYARPMPAEELTGWLARYQPVPASRG